MPLFTDNATLEEISPEDVELLGNYVAARIIKESAFMGRFIRPEQYRTKTRLARVLNVGQAYDGPVKPGDIIVYGAWEGREWPASPDETIILLEPDNVKAIVEP